MEDKDKWKFKATCHNCNKKGHFRPNWPDLVDNDGNNATPEADTEKANTKKSSQNKGKKKVSFTQDKELDNNNDDDDDAEDHFLNVGHFGFLKYDRGP